MRTRARMVAAAMLSLTLFAGACSGDEGAEETSTTTTNVDAEANADGSVAPVPDEEYAALIESRSKSLEEAGTDPCKVAVALSSVAGDPNPSSTAQVRAAVEYDVFRFKVIAATESLEPEHATAFEEAAERVAAAAEDAGYSIEFLQSEQYYNSFNTPETTAAFAAYSARVSSECELPQQGPGEAPTLDAPADEPADQPAGEGDGER